MTNELGHHKSIVNTIKLGMIHMHVYIVTHGDDHFVGSQNAQTTKYSVFMFKFCFIMSKLIHVKRYFWNLEGTSWVHIQVNTYK